MRNVIPAGMIAAAALVAGAAQGSSPVLAQEMSDKSVQTLMGYAWAITPDRFTKPNGQTVEIDRTKRESAEIPIETAREVIKVGRLSAHAQVCDLKEEHASNYRTMMAREAVKKKWTEQQMVYINQLHLVTVMLLTGKLKLIARDEGKEAKVVEEETVGKTATCSPEQREKVREAVVAYLKNGPQIAAGDAAAGGASPAGPAPKAATPAAQKK